MRDKLSLSILSNISLLYLPIYKQTIDDTRVIISEFLKRIRALVRHEKLMINPHFIGVSSTENMCIEYTRVEDDYMYVKIDYFY